MKLSPLWLLLLAACRTTAPSPPPSDSTARAAALVERFIDETLAAHPETGRLVGLHEHDGKIVPATPQAVADEIARAKAYLAETGAIDLASVADPTKLDVEITRLAAERTLFGLETLELHQRVMSYLDLFDVTSYLIRDYAPLPERTAKLLDHLEGATANVDRILAMLKPVQVRTHLETAKGALAGIGEYYNGDVAAMTKPALDADPALKMRYEAIVPASLAAVDRMLKWIDAHQAQANEEFALGSERFLRMLQVNEGLDMTLAELSQMAEANYRLNYDAYVATAKRIDPNKTVEAVAAMIAAERIPTGEAVLEAARRQLVDTRKFVEKNEIITIGSTEDAIVAVTPPFMRWNSAFLSPAGPFEKVPGSYYYMTPPDPSWPKEVQEGYLPYEGDLLATSIHEVYPGHFVHGLQIRRAPTRAQKLFDSYAFVEGWAHYTEQMMLDAGYGGDDPRLKLGQLSNALLRNCRFTAAIGLHTANMTVAQADELFQKKCFVDAGNAKQQANRGTFDPGYLSYTLGKLQIMKLRDEFKLKRKDDRLGPFHDWLMGFGSAPVALIAKRL